MTHPTLILIFKHSNTLNAFQLIKPSITHGIFSLVIPWIELLSLTILLLPTSPFPILSQFQQTDAISYLIHIEGHDILGNVSLLKEMRAFHNVSNQGSWLKFNVLALNIECREETISERTLSRHEHLAILLAHYRKTQKEFFYILE